MTCDLGLEIKADDRERVSTTPLTFGSLDARGRFIIVTIGENQALKMQLDACRLCRISALYLRLNNGVESNGS